MADNIPITEGSGTVVATDEVGSDHYQRIKLNDSTADSSDIIGASAVSAGVKALLVDASPVNPTNVSVTAYAASLVVKATAGVLYGFQGYNSLATAQFIQVYDAATLPADAAVPEVVITVPGESNFSIGFGYRGRAFATGIVIGNSTTGPTKTIGAANCWIYAQFT